MRHIHIGSNTNNFVGTYTISYILRNKLNKVTPSKTQNCVSFYTKKVWQQRKNRHSRPREQKKNAETSSKFHTSDLNKDVLDMTTINKQTSKQTIKTTAIPKP